MTDGTTDPAPTVEVDMLVRRPAAEVYEAFADPVQITKFWLARSSGRLKPAAHVSWAFKVAGAETEVDVLEARPGELLDLRWDEGQPLRITFADRGDSTLVRIEVTDFPGDTPNANAIESMSGFTLVLASLKMWLEHGIAGDLMYDRSRMRSTLLVRHGRTILPERRNRFTWKGRSAAPEGHRR